jgi:hypothetical protein
MDITVAWGVSSGDWLPGEQGGVQGLDFTSCTFGGFHPIMYSGAGVPNEVS